MDSPKNVYFQIISSQSCNFPFSTETLICGNWTSHEPANLTGQGNKLAIFTPSLSLLSSKTSPQASFSALKPTTC